jgi:PIN domain nuclease of toxin-antitoxin system
LRLLLDSHIVLWYDEGKLQDPSVIHAIRSAQEVYVSAATFWELSIKQSTAKVPRFADLFETVGRNGFMHLPIMPQHGVLAGELPLHHRDPFDRMLVAQASLEGLTLVTHDRTLQQYGIPVLLA